MSNKRKLWWLWAAFGAVFLVIEGYALATKERVVPTLSRTIWWLRNRWKWVGVVVTLVLIWLIFHLSQECFAGLC